MMLLFAVAALADPGAMRAPDGRVTIAVGGPDHGVAVWSNTVGVALSVRADGGAVEAVVGKRWRTERAFGGRVVLAGGAVVPLVDPGVGLALAPSVHGGHLGEQVEATFGFALPAVVGLAPQPSVRLPVLAETGLAFRAGPVWIGARGAIGAITVPGLAPSAALQGALQVTVAE